MAFLAPLLDFRELGKEPRLDLEERLSLAVLAILADGALADEREVRLDGLDPISPL